MGKKQDTGLRAAKQATKAARKQANFQKRQAQKIAKEKVKEMRPFLKRLRNVDLRKSVGKSERAFINRAWKEYQELTARPFKVYRTKNKKRLKIAQTFSRHEKGAPIFDVAFVPTADPKARIEFKEDRALIKSKYVTETILFFDMRNLAVDPTAEIQNTLARNPNAKQFVIMAGKYLYNGGLARSLVEKYVINLMSQYSPGGQRYEKRGPNSHYQNWLFGLVAFESSNQVSINEYRQAYRNAAERAKSAKKSQRRKRGYKYGKKF